MGKALTVWPGTRDNASVEARRVTLILSGEKYAMPRTHRAHAINQLIYFTINDHVEYHAKTAAGPTATR